MDAMVALLCFVVAILALPFKSRSRVGSENSIHWIRDRQRIRT
jgi:hypothetical protein